MEILSVLFIKECKFHLFWRDGLKTVVASPVLPAPYLLSERATPGCFHGASARQPKTNAVPFRPTVIAARQRGQPLGTTFHLVSHRGWALGRPCCIHPFFVRRRLLCCSLGRVASKAVTLSLIHI